jgi:hypothetical protein
VNVFGTSPHSQETTINPHDAALLITTLTASLPVALPCGLIIWSLFRPDRDRQYVLTLLTRLQKLFRRL